MKRYRLTDTPRAERWGLFISVLPGPLRSERLAGRGNGKQAWRGTTITIHPASQNSKAKPCSISGGANDTTYMYVHVHSSWVHYKQQRIARNRRMRSLPRLRVPVPAIPWGCKMTMWMVQTSSPTNSRLTKYYGPWRLKLKPKSGWDIKLYLFFMFFFTNMVQSTR